jgi:hypothetical protein
MSYTVKREIVKYILVLIVLVSSIVFLCAVPSNKGNVKVYNCYIAEISPDYPISVKEECRKIRSRNITT